MKGLVVEKEGGSCIVLTPSGEYKKISGSAKFNIGQEVHIPNAAPFIKAVSITAALLALAFLTSYSAGIMADNRVYAYITLDIDSSVEFAVNSDNEILSVRPYNREAEIILAEKKYTGESIENAMADFTQTAASLNYLDESKENQVVVAYCLQDKGNEQEETSKLDKIVEQQRNVIESLGLDAEVNAVVIDKKIRDEAEKLGISPGRLINEKDSRDTDKQDKELKKHQKKAKDQPKKQEKDPKKQEKDLKKQEKDPEEQQKKSDDQERDQSKEQKKHKESELTKDQQQTDRYSDKYSEPEKNHLTEGSKPRKVILGRNGQDGQDTATHGKMGEIAERGGRNKYAYKAAKKDNGRSAVSQEKQNGNSIIDNKRKNNGQKKSFGYFDNSKPKQKKAAMMRF